MSNLVEIERKFAVDEGFVVPRLDDSDSARLAGVAGTSEPETFTQEAVYYDSEDFRLSRANITLRRREGGVDDGWHLKLPAGVGAREEIHRPLSDGEPDERGVGGCAPPAELLDIVFLVLRGARVAPIARLVTTRTARQLLDAAGARLAEVVDDQVRAQTLGEQTVLTTWREIEVELAAERARGKKGAPPREAVLDAVETALRQAGAASAPHGSKLGHLLSLATASAPPAGPEAATPAPPPARARRKATAGGVLRDYLATQLDALVAADPRVRMDEPDAVHQMRVAARRLRSTLRTFSPLFPPGLPEHLDRELGDLAAALGGARDAEVQLEYFDGRLAALPADLVVGPMEESLAARLGAQAEAGRTAALAALRSERYLVLLVDLAELLRAPLNEQASRPALTELPRLVEKADARLARKVAQAVATPAGHDRDLLLHSARKQAKRLRYAGEALVPVFGADAKTLVKQATRAQELLGVHQDSVIAAGLLRTWGLESQAAGEPTAFTFGLLLGLEQWRAREAERAFLQAWPSLSEPRQRRWLRSR